MDVITKAAGLCHRKSTRRGLCHLRKSTKLSSKGSCKEARPHFSLKPKVSEVMVKRPYVLASPYDRHTLAPVTSSLMTLHSTPANNNTRAPEVAANDFAEVEKPFQIFSSPYDRRTFDFNLLPRHHFHIDLRRHEPPPDTGTDTRILFSVASAAYALSLAGATSSAFGNMAVSLGLVDGPFHTMALPPLVTLASSLS